MRTKQTQKDKAGTMSTDSIEDLLVEALVPQLLPSIQQVWDWHHIDLLLRANRDRDRVHLLIDRIASADEVIDLDATHEIAELPIAA